MDMDVNAPWTPPGLGHYCLTAVWVSGQDPLFAPFNGDPNSNTRNNNNVVWRNVHVVDMLPDTFSLIHFIMRNAHTNFLRYDLRLRALPTDRRPFPDTFLDRGEMYFDLGPDLFKRWQETGGKGEGFQIVSNRTGGLVFQILNPAGTYIRGIPFRPGEEANVSMSFRTPVNQVRTFTVDATQMLDNDVPVGGMTYELRTKPNPDTDGDGIPDDWETAHGLNPEDPKDAALDNDGDSFTNLQEYQAGTDPADPLSYLRIDRVGVANGGAAVRLSFYAEANRTYSVQYQSRLGSESWSTLSNFSQGSTSQEVTVLDSSVSAGVPKRIYRLVTPRVPEF
jgi:Bacterial TSP3 repeat